MKYLTLIITFLIVVGLSACGPSLENGSCTKEVKFQYNATLGWFEKVTSNAGTYDSYDKYLAAYREPLESWQALEPISTCDAELIDLMVNYLTMSPEKVKSKDIFNDIIFFDLDITHTGK